LLAMRFPLVRATDQGHLSLFCCNAPYRLQSAIREHSRTAIGVEARSGGRTMFRRLG
jgi:hypothetical protein